MRPQHTVRGAARALFASLLVVGGSIALGPAASAHTSCPIEASGWQPYPIVGRIGDPAPLPGIDPLWDGFVDAVEAEGLTLQQLVDQLGFEDIDELYSFVIWEVERVDLNGNRQICVRPLPPQQQAVPGYQHHVIDDRVRAAG